ncbi:MAG: 5-oxoprolinase subunit PxpA [Ilumatobacteraceae bacterium]
MGRSVDLNSDVGEGFGAWPGGPDRELMNIITSANIACGFHAGDPSIMRRTCEMAVDKNVAIGAHVSYPDLAGFGRRFIDMKPDELADAVVYQLGALAGVAHAAGGSVRYVKPHGALYNTIVRHDDQANAVATAVRMFDSTLPLLGLPGTDSAIERAAAEHGLEFRFEGFADRGYTAEGTLIPRSQPGALLTDEIAATNQAVDLAGRGITSICLHSDTPGAAELGAAVAVGLLQAGFELRSFVG